MMKKIISCLLALSILYIPVLALEVSEEIIFTQDFEGYLEGFSLENAGMQRIDRAQGIHDIVKDKKDAGNYCGRYIKKTEGEMFLRQQFPSSLYGTVTVKISVAGQSVVKAE